MYVNHGSVSLVKGGSPKIYLEFAVLGQLMPVANPDPSINLETHVFQENEAFLYVPVYNKATGKNGGLTKTLAHINFEETQLSDFTHTVTQKKRVPYCIVP